MEDEVGQKSRGAEIGAPRFTPSKASWDGLKEDAGRARETCPRAVPQPRRRAARRWRGRGASRGHRAAGTEPGAPSCGRRVRHRARPGRLLSSCPLSRLCASGARDLGPRWPLACLACTGRPAQGPSSFLREGFPPLLVLFILALPSLHWTLDLRAFFLSSRLLSSAFFCMITFLPDWNSILKKVQKVKGSLSSPRSLNNQINMKSKTFLPSLVICNLSFFPRPRYPVCLSYSLQGVS